jgi:hypothetical protein
MGLREGRRRLEKLDASELKRLDMALKDTEVPLGLIANRFRLHPDAVRERLKTLGYRAAPLQRLESRQARIPLSSL